MGDLSERTEWFSRDARGRRVLAAAGRDRLIGAAVLYALFLAVFAFQAPMWQSGRLLGMNNPHVAEASAWLRGRVDLAERLWDTAEIDGRYYNIFPPFMTLVSYLCLLRTPEGVPFTVISALFVLPIPALAYVLFLKRCRSVFGAVVMAATFVLGTSEYLVLCRILQGSGVCQLNNGITQLGLLIFLIDFFGGRRFWLGGLGLIIMGWARQPMMAYALPYVWGLWDRHGSRCALLGGGAFVAVMVAGFAVINTVRFGHPLETAYAKIYVGRQEDPQDWLAVDGTRALFSPRYVLRNLYWMNIGLPTMKRHHGGWRWEPSVKSTGIWWTTPALLYLFVDRRRIWRERISRWLMPSVAAVFATLMLYHNMGYSQRGYNRFSLDFLLVCLAMIAPYAVEGRRRYWTLLGLAWSVYYFRFIVY